MPRAQKTSDERRGVRARGNTRVRKSRRKLTAWTQSDGAKAVMDPALRSALVEGTSERYLDALRAHDAAEHHRAALAALQALLEKCPDGPRLVFEPTRPGWGRTVEKTDVDRATVEAAIAMLVARPPYMPIGETKRIGVDAAFVADVEPRVDDDMIAEAMFPKKWKDSSNRDRLVQRVKDLRRR